MSKKLNELKKAFVDRFLHMSLRTKQLMVTLLGLAALVLFAMVLGNAVYRSVRSRGLSNFRMSADSAADSIETETDMIYRNAVVILRNADVRTLLQEELTEEEMLRIISIKNQAVSFIRILEEISYIDSTEIYLAEEREFLADHDLFRSFREAENDERFRGFVSGSAKGMWAVGGEDFCYYTRVVRLDDYRRTAAVIRIGYSAEHLKQLLQPTL
ncbi:MAG: hypothetical protein IKR59_08120, partial [Lachnospiraceae bacterium]|nr:hypothetical protein [Lachnospiraceae bacterium]